PDTLVGQAGDARDARFLQRHELERRVVHGKTARIARYCLPPVHSPDPFQACCATPSETKATWISPASSSLMFSVGPSVARAKPEPSSLRVNRFARPSPYS